ncbi:hypothetical protein OH76DRAFT_327566 [Lentinus brumalis]|uniref:Uncharacterized protein n=1 Tax=Lentinus brumalis TaxID=2498619 RepID=A0A371DFQ7_9APHY|nr:hypothetical protein OH76DRAFT_327566 [Polyporus brumalis]
MLCLVFCCRCLRLSTIDRTLRHSYLQRTDDGRLCVLSLSIILVLAALRQMSFSSCVCALPTPGAFEDRCTRYQCARIAVTCTVDVARLPKVHQQASTYEKSVPVADRNARAYPTTLGFLTVLLRPLNWAGIHAATFTTHASPPKPTCPEGRALVFRLPSLSPLALSSVKQRRGLSPDLLASVHSLASVHGVPRPMTRR